MELGKYPKTGNTKTFHIEAIQLPIVYNKYGNYDPNGLLYVLRRTRKGLKEKPFRDLRWRYRSHIRKYSRWSSA